MYRGIRVFFSVSTLALVLSACSMGDIPFVGDDDEKGKGAAAGKASETEKTPEEFYQSGKDFLSEGRYLKAIKQFSEIERLYPFSKLAAKSQVMMAYTHYKDATYDEAISVIERFTRFSPGHEDISYMYYLKALAWYDRIADVKRDQRITNQAMTALEEVVKRFPQSSYARDAKLKIDLVRDHLAGKEMEIGRYYLKDRKFVAGINRFSRVVKKYERTSHVEEALYRLTESYLALGIEAEAKKSAAVLGYNYPDSRWYKYAYRLLEEGKNSPQAGGERWYSFILSIGEDDKTESRPLGRENEADSWFTSLKDLF